MKSLSERLPMIPRVTATEMNAAQLAARYAGWQLLETDPQNGEILLCLAETAGEHNRSRNLTILCKTVARVWLLKQEAVLA
ncbi:MAG: hypothetical protein K8L99_26920 [Anaerolineae bacterium]|nr:hypothetical protein [Anaerolineae bacterium]